MKPFFYRSSRNRPKRGFNLVETTLSLGVMSFGFLALVPLLALGTKTAWQARDNRASTQIAQTLIEEARQGMLSSGTIYLDADENRCAHAQAIYTVQATLQPVTGNPTGDMETSSPQRLTLHITPTGAPDRARTYAVVLPMP
jgi:uncharacterized protein (TIGR02598 family)